MKPISLETATLVGAVSEPIVKISEAQTLYFDKIMGQREISLSDSKYRVWKNRYLRVINSL